MIQQKLKFKETKIGMIPEGWEIKRIAEIGSVITGKTPPTKEAKFWGGNYPFITPTDIRDFDVRYSYHVERFLSEEWVKASKSLLPKDSVCFVCIGSTIGKMCLTKEPSFTNQQINSIMIDSKNDPKFIFYQLRNNKQRIKKEYGGGGAAKEIISKSTFETITLGLPELNEQETIASALSSLDDKIELNREMNTTLEKIGQALFKHWFIDFEFPNEKGKPYKSSGGEMVDSELGEIPEGWGIDVLPEVSLVVDCLHTKKPEMIQEGPLLLQVYNISTDGTLDFTEKYPVSEGDYREWIKNIEVKEGDCLVTNAGRVGAVAQVPVGFEGGIGRNITAIRPVGATPAYLFRYLFSSYGIGEIGRQTDQGTVLDSLNVKGIKKIRILIPRREVMDRFEEIARPVREKVERNKSENDSLMAIRDSLLPRLMSGQIRVPVG